MSKRPLWVLVIVVTAIILVAVIAVVVRGGNRAQDLDVATPEGTVQAFVRAVYDDDLEKAATYLDPDGDCTEGDLADSYYPEKGRVVLVDTTTTDAGARVTVDVVFSNDLLNTDSYTERQNYRLVSTDDGWVLQGTPWPLYTCEGGR